MAGTTPLPANKDYTLLLLLLVAFAADGAGALLLGSVRREGHEAVEAHEHRRQRHDRANGKCDVGLATRLFHQAGHEQLADGRRADADPEQPLGVVELHEPERQERRRRRRRREQDHARRRGPRDGRQDAELEHEGAVDDPAADPEEPRADAGEEADAGVLEGRRRVPVKVALDVRIAARVLGLRPLH